MHQFQGFARTQRTQSLDRTETDSTAAMAGHAGGLVDRQQASVLVDDAGFNCRQQSFRRSPFVSRFTETNWRNPYLITCFQPGVGFRPTAVHAHLATTNNLINQRPRRTFKLRSQKVIEPLACTVVRDADDPYLPIRLSLLWFDMGHAGCDLLHSLRDIRV